MIAVIMRVHRRIRSLHRAIASVQVQDVGWRLLLVGDGASRSVCEAIEPYLVDPRIRFWNLPHGRYPREPLRRWWVAGLDALNFALDQLGDTPWWGVLDDDDELLPEGLRALYEVAEGSTYHVVYGRSETWVAGKPTSRFYGEWPPGAGRLCNGAFIARSSLPYRYEWGCLDRHLPLDADLWERMVAGGVRFQFVPELVHRYHRAWADR